MSHKTHLGDPQCASAARLGCDDIGTEQRRHPAAPNEGRKGDVQGADGQARRETRAALDATTLGASVDGKPNAGAIKTLTGESIDFFCYLQVGKHGEAHRGRAQKCFKAGQPIGLLTADGNIYMLTEEEHDPRRDGMGNFREAASDHAGHIMEVTGTASTVRGFNALYVHGFLKK